MSVIINRIIKNTKENESKDAYIYFAAGTETFLDYKFYRRLIFAFYQKIRSLNIGDKKNAIIVGDNSPHWTAAYFAAHMNGLTLVHADTRFTVDEYENICKFTSPGLAICGKKYEQNFDSSIPKIYLEDVTPLNEEIDYEIVPLADNQAMSIITTSGTTGDPKGVMLTEDNYLSNLSVFDRGGDYLGEDDKMVGILPFYHVYPFTITVLAPLYFGVTLILPQSLKGEDIFGSLKKYDGTILVAIPRVLDLFCNKVFEKIEKISSPKRAVFKLLFNTSRLMTFANINIGKVLFGSIHGNFKKFRYFACGGAKLDPKTHRKLKYLGFKTIEAYGLTETSPIATINDIDDPVPGSVGKALNEVAIKIEKSDPKLQHGEICIKGPNVMKGYYKRPDLTAEVIKDGWFHSGDLGYLDNKGRLFITGREKEVIVLSTGKNIYPDELEKTYKASTLIKEICVTLVEEEGKQYLTAVIFPDKEYVMARKVSNILQELKFEIDNVSQTQPPHKRISKIEIYPTELPKTALGKLRRFQVDAFLKDKRGLSGQGEDDHFPEEELDDPFLEFVGNVLKLSKRPRYHHNLETDLGLDSLEKLELFSAINNAYGIKTTEEQQVAVLTVKDLKELIPDTLRTESDLQDSFWEDQIIVQPVVPLEKHVSITKNPLMTVIRYAFHLFLKLIFKVFFSASLEGKEHLKDLKGPIIIAPNHKSLIDGFLIYGTLPFKVINNCFFMSIPKYFDRMPLVLVRKIFRVILTGTSSTSVSSLQYSYQVLKDRKRIMCVFPEGERSIDLHVKRPKRGIGHVAKLSKAGILPVFIGGSEEVLSRSYSGLRRAKLSVKILPVVKTDGDVDQFLSKWCQQIEKENNFSL